MWFGDSTESENHSFATPLALKGKNKKCSGFGLYISKLSFSGFKDNL